MYKDLARTVREYDQFEFLADIIPNPTPFKEAVDTQKKILKENKDQKSIDDEKEDTPME